jgi:hypothetical protein
VIPGFDPVSASRRLDALAAAIQAFPPERQAAVLREYLEAELGRLEALEDGHHAFLAECVLLAVDNMQDARLQSVEERLAALESPDGPWMAETLTDAALVFAFSFAALATVEVAGGAVLLWFGQAALAPAARETVEAVDNALLSKVGELVSSLSDMQAGKTVRDAQLRGVTTVLDGLRGGPLSSSLWPLGKALLNPIAPARSVADALSKTFTVTAGIDAIQAEMLVGHLAMAEGLEASVAARVGYEAALRGDAAKPNAQWRKFLDDASGGLALAPAYTIFQDLWKNVPSAGPADAEKQAEPFLASAPAGRLLTSMRESRAAVREDYAVLRAGLRFRTDDTFIEDPLVTQLTGLVAELLPLRGAYRALDDTVRPLIVRGYEAALWWAFLQTNGMLGTVEGDGYEAYEYDEGIKAGAVVDGHVITKVPPRVVFPLQDPADPMAPQEFYLYEADFYPGVRLLTEGQAEYLYASFAAPYFAVSEHAATLPAGFEYDPNNYVGVRAMPERLYHGMLANGERAKRLDEMRLMAILFFQKLPRLEDPTSSGLLAALGKVRGTMPSAAAWMALHPAASAPVPAKPLADGSGARAAQAAAPALNALLSDSGVLTRALYETKRSELRAAIAELRNDIKDIQDLADGELSLEGSSRGMDLEAYDAFLKAEQEELRKLYARVLTSAQFDAAEATRLEAQYGALVERLATWTLPPTTSRAKASPFRFATPAPTR